MLPHITFHSAWTFGFGCCAMLSARAAVIVLPAGPVARVLWQMAIAICSHHAGRR